MLEHVRNLPGAEEFYEKQLDLYINLCLWQGLKRLRGFEGNVWWSSLEHVRNLPRAEVRLDVSRWDAEYSFIGTGSPRVLELYGQHLNLYENLCSRSKYEGAATVR